MKNISEIQCVLKRLIGLLSQSDHSRWTSLLDQLNNEIEYEPDETTSKILCLFGGVGSFGDIVLYRNGQPLIDENDELYSLRSALYDLCHE